MNAPGSLLCGLAAWAVPGIAILRGKSGMGELLCGGGLCTAALYLQMLEYESLILAHEWSGLEDICHGETLAATVLIVVWAALSLLAWLLPKRGGEHR